MALSTSQEEAAFKSICKHPLTSKMNMMTQSAMIIEEWQVECARFISYRSIGIPSTHHSLAPLSGPNKRRRGCGNWISTSSASAHLKLIYQPSSTGSDDAILVVSISSRILEEHRVSKMHFSWPQLSCVAGFPPRGSKAVFVSYKDDLGQIQKFALRFDAVSDAEKFMNIVKEILDNGNSQQLQLTEFKSEISSQAEVVHSDGLTYRPDRDGEYTISADSNTQPIIPSFEFNGTQEFISQERIQDPDAAEIISAFPPSFTQLLMNCQPLVDKAKPIVSEGNLKSQFMQYLQETSFQELLATVENVISELGDDLML